MQSTNGLELTAQESRTALRGVAVGLGWLALLALTVATAVHAVTLTIEHIGFTGGVMAIIRIGAPVLTEVFCLVVAVGFASYAWRGAQRLYGVLIEVTWLVFAGLNLVTAFSFESGGQLPYVLEAWLRYGLPLSALVTGALFYLLLRNSPDHQRENERRAAVEAHAMHQFSAEKEVLLSPQMSNVLRQRGWLNVIEGMQKRGYTAEQIAFMFDGVPQLQALTGGSGDAGRHQAEEQAATVAVEDGGFLAQSVNGRE